MVKCGIHNVKTLHNDRNTFDNNTLIFEEVSIYLHLFA